MNALLPPEFSQLEHLVAEWAIEDGHERYVKRVNSSMDEIRAFYDEVFPSPRKPSPTSTSSTTPNRCPMMSRTCATCSTR